MFAHRSVGLGLAASYERPAPTNRVKCKPDRPITSGSWLPPITSKHASGHSAVAISIALALVVMIALALAGGATSQARAATSGVQHQALGAAATPAALSASNPLHGQHFYWNPSSSAAIAERQLQAQGQTAQAATIQKIARTPRRSG